MATRIQVEGLEEVTQKLRRLGDKRKAKNITRKAARRAMNVVRDAARENARAIDDPETKARIYKNIVTQSGRTYGGYDVVMRVGVRGGASSNQYSEDISGLSGGDTRHWRYIEFGTKYTPAVPFMRPALFNNMEKVLETFTREFNSELSQLLGERI
ncbi:HK97-gp10 family putative phage morphogenesis protein [Acinetobacter pollinis]|uniref:HK97 gp10 family phage protein n=1 Tax=Acinetobacter pollinis TaxID=2605270 RepID=A0ABU6DRM3_9GAMM|nr:HK97-gp10 family putative phage morphogenesis protein [Acinetobacter pollinis]MEB5475533.1 HK97 gp10 family phage protein [Acinetobacter pollinis]